MDSPVGTGHSLGHLLLLCEEEQYGLSVEQQPPARQTKEQHDDDALLQDGAHAFQVISAIRLQGVKHYGQRRRKQYFLCLR